MHDLALHSDASTVNDAHLPETLLQGLKKVLLYHTLDLLRPEGVKIDPILDGNLDRLFTQFFLLPPGFNGRLSRCASD
jgi:hypothetical protein